METLGFDFDLNETMLLQTQKMDYFYSAGNPFYPDTLLCLSRGFTNQDDSTKWYRHTYHFILQFWSEPDGEIRFQGSDLPPSFAMNKDTLTNVRMNTESPFELVS